MSRTAAVPAAWGGRDARVPGRLDPRLNAFRPELADERLRGRVKAARYVTGREAIVTAGLLPVRRAPSPDAPLDTFYHCGEPALVFDLDADYAWCQSGFDGYVGYVEARYIAIGPA